MARAHQLTQLTPKAIVRGKKSLSTLTDRGLPHNSAPWTLREPWGTRVWLFCERYCVRYMCIAEETPLRDSFDDSSQHRRLACR